MIPIISGVASVIGIFTVGYVFDSVGAKVVGRIVCVMYFLMCWVFIVGLRVENVGLMVLVPFLWTFLLRFEYGLFPVLCSKYYAGKTESFAVIKLIPAIFNIAFQVAMVLTKNTISFLMLALLSLLALPALYWFGRVENSYREVEKGGIIVEEAKL